jgi:hypothetical protein
LRRQFSLSSFAVLNLFEFDEGVIVARNIARAAGSGAVPVNA